MSDESQTTTDGTETQTAQSQRETGEQRLDEVEQRIEDHQAVIDGLKEHLGGDGDGFGPVATRRGVLTAGGVLGLLGLGAGTASADPSGQVGTSSDPLQDLYTETLHGHSGTLTLKDSLNLDGNKLTSAQSIKGSVTGNTEITDLVGSGLTISSGSLAATSSAAWGDGSANSNLLEPTDGSKTGIEDVTQIRSNGSVTVDIDANDGGSSESFAVRQDKDGTSAKPFEVFEGGPITFRENVYFPSGTQINYGSNAQDQTLVDLPVNASLSAGTDHSYAMQIKGTDFLTIYSENDGSANLQNEAIKAHQKLDLQGNNLETSSGGMTVKTNDNGNLTLNPGSGNELVASNLSSGSSSDNLLVRDGDGHVNESSKTANDIGGKWQDGSDNSNLLEPSDGTKTGIEDVTQIRSNGSLTVDIDADNNSTTEKFVIQSNTDSGSADTLVKVFEYGAVQIPSGNLNLQGNDLNYVNSLDNQGSAISFFDDIDMGPYAIQSTTEDSTLTITQDSNSSDATPEDLILKTKDSSANNAVGDIVFDADTDNVSSAAVVFKTSQTERARVNGSGLNVDNLTDNGTGSVSMGNKLDLNANDITNTNEITTTTASVGTLDNDGSAISVGDALNLSNSDSIQDSGTDAIAFDGSQNVTVANGTLDVQGGPLGSGTITNSAGSLTLGTSDGISGLSLNPDGPIYTEGNKIVGLVEDVVIETETNNNSSADTKKILLTGRESDSSDTANIELSPGSNNGDVQVTNGTLDVQTGTVQNTSGALSLSTGSGDLSLQPAGNIDVNSNRISNAKEIHSDNNNITFKGSADVNLDGTRLTEKGGDMNIISVNSVNVDIDSDNNDTDGTRDFNVTKDGGSTTLFTVNDGGQVDIFQGDLDMNSSGNVVNTSDARVKTAIEPIAHPIEKLTELEPRTYEWKAKEAADGREAGVIAQSVEDVLPEAVQEDEDGFLQLAYRQLTPLVIGAVQDQQDEIEKLEADLNDCDERIDDLEAENADLRERNAELESRLDRIEAELGIDATASQQGVADD
jgi:hypothetical protein